MKCSNCGNEITVNDKFCMKCGHSVAVETLNVEQPQIQKENNNKVNKKIIIVSCSILLIGLIIFIVFKIINKDNLNWDKTYKDLKPETITQTSVKLGFTFNNDKELNNIKHKTTCGTAIVSGKEVIWNLNNSKGKCKITISYGLKSISKEYTVIQDKFGVLDGISYKVNENSDEDLDNDKLTNKEEKKHKTNPELADSDMDNLDDYYEIFTSKTDPLKEDTDNDGLSDYDEIELKLDPLKEDSKGDGVKDGERTLTYEYISDGVNVKITGKGNIASSTAEISENTKISSKEGLIDKLYNFGTKGNITEAIVTIPYTDDELIKSNLSEDNLSLYYYNEKKSTYEKIKTEVDKQNKTITAYLKHFSNYVLGNYDTKKTESNEALFVIDNSWSMYSNKQYKNIMGKEYEPKGLDTRKTLPATDASGMRFTVTNSMINKLSSKGFKMGVAEFRGDYARVAKIGTSKDTLKKKVKAMNGSFLTSSEGTNINGAITAGISEFSSNADNKYIILLTDGQDSFLSFQASSIIKTAKANNVKVCSVGFGGGSKNSALARISAETGCNFSSSSSATGLTELFTNLGSTLSDDMVDVDDDGKDDGRLIADSGFIVNKNGFSFTNYGTNLSSGGHCFGMATIAELYYTKKLPLKLDSKTVGESKSYAYDLTNSDLSKNVNLYDYKLNTNILKFAVGYEHFGETKPTDLYKLNDDLLTYNDSYRKEILDSKIYDISEYESTLSKEEQINRWGVNYKKAESAILNENKLQKSSIDNNDIQLINAIYAAFIKQNQDNYFLSSSNIVTNLRNMVGSESSEKISSAAFIKLLADRLNSGDAPVIFAEFSANLHAINAISLVQDSEDLNHYYIGVYDNNYPGEKRYVDVKCNKKTCVTAKNNYYGKNKQPIRMTYSLEEDLKYFN